MSEHDIPKHILTGEQHELETSLMQGEVLRYEVCGPHTDIYDHYIAVISTPLGALEQRASRAPKGAPWEEVYDKIKLEAFQVYPDAVLWCIFPDPNHLHPTVIFGDGPGDPTLHMP